MGLIDDEEQRLRSIELALVSKFGERVPRETICSELESAMHDFDGARIRTYVPVLLQKRVTDVLRTRVIRLPD